MTRDALVQLLTVRSVKRGDFVLASGMTSSIYVDARLTTMSPEGMALIGSLGLERIKSLGWNPDSIGGLTLGADPVAYAISHVSISHTLPVRAFTVRKKAKTHGTEKLIEGPFRSGDRVVIAEDVITSGNSALQAIHSVVAAGGIIVGVLAVVDRESGGSDAIRAHGYQVTSLVTIAELTD